MAEVTDQHTAYHALALANRGEYKKLEKLLKTHGSWSSAYEANSGKNPTARNKAWAELTRQNISLLLADDEEFPALLREIPWTPFGLYVLGALPKEATFIAIVGTRKATKVGLETARRFGRELGKQGLVIVSGLALGTDASAHEGALDANARTIGVLARGLDEIYPRQNERLAQRILKAGGAIVSEYPPGVAPLPHQFIERNRIASGLSRGVVVVEAPEKSGALATARFAVEQNRDVFVVPGAINNPNYAGSNKLIKSGATLVSEPVEILEHLGITPPSATTMIASGQFDKLEKSQTIIIKVLAAAGAPLLPDEVVEACGLDLVTVNRQLSLLSIEGHVKEAGGKYFIV